VTLVGPASAMRGWDRHCYQYDVATRFEMDQRFNDE
jgi:hypothetical protein